MSRRFKESAALLRAAAVLGVVGAACLTRPVVTSDPNLKTNFTNIIHSVAVDKLDILFMIDNSASMGDKQTLLSLAVPDMINRLVSPNCVDANNNTVGPSTNGMCGNGSALEFPPVHDMHLGIVSSSLGGRGSSTTCLATDLNPANMALNGHNDDHGYLIARGGANETAIPKAQNNFLAWYPSVAANMGAGAMPPPSPETAVGDPNTAGTLIGDFTQMIIGVHEHGCGFEAQNESWYRFLVQPDPFLTINVANSNPPVASYSGIDPTILTQRAAFLRPDSLVAVIVVTDETQETANPLSVGGLGYLFESSPWPSSPTSAAPEGTAICANKPLDPTCVSCSIVSQSAADFATQCPVDPPNGQSGYLDPSDDNINVRFFHQKVRFGVFAGYPGSRYVTGLTSPKVPDRANEEDASGNYVGDQAAHLNCVNPLFAQNLPTDPMADLCHLQPGPRTPDLVYYALIGGVPHQFLQAAPGDPECAAGTNAADCPQKDTLTDADWLKITGPDPENYNFVGADFHMLESETSRGPCNPTATDTCDPINGREWDTGKKDLQYACIFNLPAPKDCTQPQFTGACDCAVGSNSANTPLCQKNAAGTAYTTTQVKGKAYPTISELVVAHGMAGQGIVSSLCPIHPQPIGGAQDPVYGYRPAVTAIVNRLKNSLSVQCLPQKLTPDPVTQAVPCLVLVTLPQQGNQDVCNGTPGLGPTPSDVLSRFQAPAHALWVQSGGAKTGVPDPSSFPTCTINELTTKTDNGADFPNGTDCSMSPNQGWCYVEGAAAGGSCAQQLLFTSAMPPHGAQVNLQCIEQANGAIGNASP